VRSNGRWRTLYCEMNGFRLTVPDATFTNGRYVLPPHARGVLVLADPPEAGWQIEESSDDARLPQHRAGDASSADETP
jgi:hypothetical protein